MTTYTATTASDFNIARELFIEYANSLGFSLCFQGFDKEIATIDQQYALPNGILLLLQDEDTGKTVGCVALRKQSEGIAELKRMYIQPEFRGKGGGEWMLKSIIQLARTMAFYQSIVLDTIPETMGNAIALYRKMGFVEIPPYYKSDVKESIFMKLEI
jgi:putative acetyltransferase